MTRRPVIQTVGMYLFLSVTSIAILYPLVFMQLATFTSPTQYYRTTVLPVPDIFDLRNYVPILFDCAIGCIYHSMVVTGLREIWYLFWMLTLSIFGGYVFAR